MYVYYIGLGVCDTFWLAHDVMYFNVVAALHCNSIYSIPLYVYVRIHNAALTSTATFSE